MECSGGGGDSSGGDMSDPHRRKKRYYRHTGHQIQHLEAIFKECPHPDGKTRSMLSRELGLHPRQIKFWFQNRRTQMKAQHERLDNFVLRQENDKIRCENIAIREALNNVICPSCGDPRVTEDSDFDELKKLHMENAQLRDEFDRLSNLASKYMRRPISQLQPVQPMIHMPSLDLMMASFRGHGNMITESSLHHDLVPGNSSRLMTDLPFPMMSFSDTDKSLMADVATNPMDELVRLMQSDEASLWVKSWDNPNKRIFPRVNGNLENPNVRVEASRDSGVVMMNALALVYMFMDANKWMELFPTIVSRARTVEVISSSGVLGSQSGTLQLMYGELQVLSALAPTRQLYFLRSCRQIDQGSWIIVNVSYDILNQDDDLPCKARHLPSGCLIKDLPNGYSEVKWVEHWEVEDRDPIHRLYRDLIHSGLAFGAERWLSTLRRMCERFTCSMVRPNSTRDLGGVISSPEGKRSTMMLAQRMVSNFCSTINPSNGQQWATISDMNEFEVRATLQRSADHRQPNGFILSASATLWMFVQPRTIFDFLRDERNRSQWDILSHQSPMQEVAHIASGSDSGNCISILRAYNTSQNNNTLILQESCTDSTGSLVVYCPVDLPAINAVINGDDSSYIPLTPAGFRISPDGKSEQSKAASMSSSNNHASSSPLGSLVTVVYQILLTSFPAARTIPENVTTVNRLIRDTVQLIKVALNCNDAHGEGL